MLQQQQQDYRMQPNNGYGGHLIADHWLKKSAIAERHPDRSAGNAPA